MTDEFLRHALATLAYRCGKVLRDAPETMEQARICDGAMTGAELLAHVSDVLKWGCGLAQGDPVWSPEPAGRWPDEVARFYSTLARLDSILADGPADDLERERLFQGPIADCLTHTGQLATLRRIVGSPVARENYFAADVAAGRVGPDQHFAG